MKPLNLQEFAEDMRRKGDIRDADLADEILALIDIEEEVAEPYSDLRAEIEHHAKDSPVGPDDAVAALEWLGARSTLLADIEKLLEEAKRPGDADDVIKELLGTLKAAEAILEKHGWTSGDFLGALEKLAENVPTPMEFDL